MDSMMKHGALGVAIALAGGSTALAQEPVKAAPQAKATKQAGAKVAVQMSDAQLDLVVAGQTTVFNPGRASRCNRRASVNCC